MNDGEGNFNVSAALIVGAVLFVTIGGGGSMLQAQYERAKTARIVAQSNYALSQAAAGAVRMQTWLIAGGAALFVAFLVLFVWSQVQAEKRHAEMLQYAQLALKLNAELGIEPPRYVQAQLVEREKEEVRNGP